MKIWKKLCAVITAGAICAVGLPWTVSAAEVGDTGTYGDLTYTVLEDDTVEITRCDKSATEVEIPAEIDGMAVTSIGEDTFSGCTNLTEITIPDSVTSIGDYAFDGCTNLTEITIPDSMTSIGGCAFYECTSLTEITIPDSVTSIGSNVFRGTPWLEARQAENPLVIVNHILIDGITCEGSVVIPDSVTSIGETAFSCCDNLTEITIPDSVTSIGDSAFDSCTSLTEIIIPDSVTSIGRGAFYECTSLTEITIPDSVTSIGSGAFGNTPWLEARQAENPLVIVNHILIDGTTCEGSVVIPDNVTSIGETAFSCCDNLTEITIPDSVTSIGDCAFQRCTSLTEITIPDSVTSIGVDAFWYCENLTEIIIPDSVTSIGSNVFRGTPWLEARQAENPLVIVNHILIDGITCEGSVVIPDNVTCIGGVAFAERYKLTDIAIPDSVTSIGDYAFYECTNLTDVYYSGTEEEWDAITIGDRNVPLTDATIHFNSTPPEITATTGDIDGDDKIDANDAYFTLLAYAKMSVGSDSGLTDAQIQAADVDENGTVDANDAYYILLYYAKHSVGQNVTWAELLG